MGFQKVNPVFMQIFTPKKVIFFNKKIFNEPDYRNALCIILFIFMQNKGTLNNTLSILTYRI